MATQSKLKQFENTISIDPGRTTGWAVFSQGKLLKNGHLEVSKFLKEVISDPENAVVVIEKPKYRGYANNKSPIDDLLTLAVTTGEISGFYRGHGAQVELVWPTDWKGSTPKKISHNRILACLTEEEKEGLDKDHNALDAVGIGLWRVGRMRK